MTEAAGGGDAGDLARLTGWDRVPSGVQRMTYVVDATAEVLRAAAQVPEQVEVLGETLVIKPEPWRDFQPGDGMPAGGSELRVHISVRTTVRGRFPPLLRPDWVAVIHAGKVWMTPGAIEQLNFGFGDQDYYVVMARYGPQWGPDIDVDVLLQLRDQQGVAYRLRSTGVRVIRTD